MTEEKTSPPAEFGAIQTVYSALEPLDDDARARVLTYIASLLEIATQPVKQSSAPEVEVSEEEESAIKVEEQEAPKYATFADLYDSAQPNTNGDKALVAGYWLQVCQNTESFDGHSANKELKHLGHGVENITNAINVLKNQKPALALQLKKSGKSQQARKTYKITVAGIKAVEDMING